MFELLTVASLIPFIGKRTSGDRSIAVPECQPRSKQIKGRTNGRISIPRSPG